MTDKKIVVVGELLIHFFTGSHTAEVCVLALEILTPLQVPVLLA